MCKEACDAPPPPTKGFARAPPHASEHAAATDPHSSAAGEKSKGIEADAGQRIIFGGGGGGGCDEAAAAAGGGEAAGELQVARAERTAGGIPAAKISAAWVVKQAPMAAWFDGETPGAVHSKATQ